MLPDPNSDWPPSPYDVVFKDIAKWAELWKGTSTALSNYQPPNKRGRLKRTADAFFGRQDGTQIPSNARQVHVPIAGDIYRCIGGLMFANGVTFGTGAGSEEDIADDDLESDVTTDEVDPVADALDEVANTDRVKSLLTAAAESGSALGGYVLRVVWDKEIDPFKPWLDRVEADHCIPEFRWGRLVAITFWSTRKEKGDIVWRHFQEYGRGWIRHALFKGNAVNVGTQEPLDSHDMTKGLVSTVDEFGTSLGDGVDEEGRIATGAEEYIAAVYIPNRLPNPAWREDEAIRDLGMSDTPNDVLPLMSMADEVWGSLMRDVDQAKGRVVIPKMLLDYAGPGQGTSFDYDQEVFHPIGMGLDEDSKPVIEQIQFEIRVEEHLNTYAALLKEILRRCGISPLTFGLVDNVATTATEVQAWTRDTTTTVSTKRRLTTPELTEIMTVLLTVYGKQWDKPEVIPTEPIDLEWPAIVQESEREIFESVQMLFNASSASISERVRRVNPTWPPTRIKQEVEKIKKEFGIDQPPPPSPFDAGESGGLPGAPGAVPPGDDPDAPPTPSDAPPAE